MEKILLKLGITIVSTFTLLSMINDNSNNNNNYVLAQNITDASNNIVSHDSVTVLLDGKNIPAKNFLHIYDSTPSTISLGHVAAHLPCDANSNSLVNVVGGIAPNLVPLSMTFVKELSVIGNVCMYHADIPQKDKNIQITDIALLNSNETDIQLPDTTSVVIHVSSFGKEIVEHTEETDH